MDLCWNVLVVACLWGVTELGAGLVEVARDRRWAGAFGVLGASVVPRAVWRLALLGVVALAGFLVCAVGFMPAARVARVEDIGAHPLLAPLLLVPGCVGLGLAVMRFVRCAPAFSVRRAAFIGLVGLIGAGIALWCCLPPARVDETLYHLALPVQYLRAGGFVVIPGHGNSGFPALGEMLFFWCLGAGAMPAARAVQLLVLVMGLDALAALLPAARRQVWGAGLLFVLTPVVLWELPCAYIDVLQGVCEVVGLALLACWAVKEESALVLLGGWLTGCAAACKYLALAQVPLFVLAALLVVRSRRPALVPAAFAACGLALLPPLPWLVRNAFVFGNPLFPFGADFFPDGRRLLPTQMQVLDLFMMQHGPLGADGRPLEGLDAILHLPVAFFTQAAFSSPAFDGVMGWLPLACLGLVWLARRSPASDDATPPLLPTLLGCYALFRVAVWLSTSWQMRFLIGPQLAMCLLCTFALARMPRILTLGLGAALLLLQGRELVRVRMHAPRFDAAAIIDREARHRLRLDYDSASALCDRAMALPVDNLMLVWTQRRALWCDVPLVADSYDEGASLAVWLEAGAPAALSQLHAHHISHVLIDEKAFTTVPPGLAPEERIRLQARAAAYESLKAHALTALETHDTVALLQVAPPAADL